MSCTRCRYPILQAPCCALSLNLNLFCMDQPEACSVSSVDLFPQWIFFCWWNQIRSFCCPCSLQSCSVALLSEDPPNSLSRGDLCRAFCLAPSHLYLGSSCFYFSASAWDGCAVSLYKKIVSKNSHTVPLILPSLSYTHWGWYLGCCFQVCFLFCFLINTFLLKKKKNTFLLPYLALLPLLRVFRPGQRWAPVCALRPVRCWPLLEISWNPESQKVVDRTWI